MSVYEYKTHIKYQDINENNQLSDRGLLNILSEAAGMHSEIVGYGLNDIEKTGVVWMLLFWKLKIFKKPCWNTKLVVKTWARQFNKISSWRDFEVFTDEGEKIAIATTNWVLINNETRSIGKVNEKIVNEYGIVEKSVFEENIVGKLKLEDNMEKIYEYTSTRRDIDVNHHVNNVHYLDIAYDALPDGIDINFSNIEIYYKKQIKLGESIICYYSKNENIHTIALKNANTQELHAILKFS